MRKRKRGWMSLVMMLVLVVAADAQVGALPKRDRTLRQISDAKFHVGDVWEYRTRPGEERSRLTITRIDESPDMGIIVHVSVGGLHFVNCHGGSAPDNVRHMPFTRKILEASVTKKVESSDAPTAAYDSAYEEWRRHTLLAQLARM